jgi:hypothetical protein
MNGAMTMKRVILSAFFAIAFIAGVSAQTRPSFAGTWKAAGSFNTWTITGPGMSRTERRSIEADGTMKVQTTITMMQGKPAPPPPPGAGGGLVLKKVK